MTTLGRSTRSANCRSSSSLTTLAGSQPANSALRSPALDAIGHGASEAPRGTLYHRYEIDAEGLISDVKIVPPTSQNQAAIEADIAAFAPRVLNLPMNEATHSLEQLIRSYDPCISCATHFLDLRVERS